MNVSAIVMASGMSKRMNMDKLLMKINDMQIFEYILDTIIKCNFCDKTVVAKDEEILNKSRSLGFNAVKNKEYENGQSRSIILGMENSKNSDGYMFFVADQPFVSVETVNIMLDSFEKNLCSIIVPRCKDKTRNPVIFPHMLREELLMLYGDNGGKAVIIKNKDKIVFVDIDREEEFMDIDTMEDYENASKKVER
jgi:molybdenum cofactor cytidylyltransferase